MLTPQDLTSNLIPPTVRAAALASLKFREELGKPVEDGAGSPPPAVVVEPVQDEVKEPEVVAEPEKVEAEPEKVEAEPEVAKPVETSAAEAKIARLDGMLKAAGRDTRAARDEAKALRAEIQALKDQIAAPKAAVGIAAEAAIDAPDDDAELIESLGAANLERLERRLGKKFAPAKDFEQVRSEVGSVAQRAAATDQERFETAMDSMVPGWQEINQTDTNFQTRLDERVPGSRSTYRQEATAAIQAHDASTLAEIFTLLAPSAAPAKAVAVALKPKLDKKALASPASTPAAADPVNTEKPLVKFSEKQKFADDVRDGVYESRDPKQAALLQEKFRQEQARIDEAQRSGRLVPG